MDNPVLVCGAGPAGLVSAIQLARFGIPFHCIDKRVGIDLRSKALSINSAGLELFEDLGVVEQILEQACPNQTIHIHWKNKPLHEVSLAQVPSRFPFFAMLPQFETEKILRRRLADLGGRIEEGTSLIGLHQEADHVVATTKNITGMLENRRYSYVLGCDGAHSVVRELSGIQFEGHDYDMYFVMCDASVDWPGKIRRWHYFVDDDRFLILIPLTNDLHRLVFKMDGRFDPEKIWTCKDFCELVESMGLDLVLGEPVWTSSSRFYNRLASSFRHGRAFLVGDAAHLFSPIGGQGMNTGIQDSYNLAWKICLRHSGIGESLLLNSYEPERRSLALAVRKSTDSMTNVIAGVDRDPRGLLRNFLPSAKGGAFLTDILPKQLSGTVVSYGRPSNPNGSKRPAIQAGDRLPYLAKDLQLHDPSGRYLLLTCFFTSGAANRQIVKSIERLLEEFAVSLRVVGLGESGAVLNFDRKMVSCEQVRTWQSMLGLKGDCLILSRPDRFVDYVCRCSTPADIAALRKHLAQSIRHLGNNMRRSQRDFSSAVTRSRQASRLDAVPGARSPAPPAGRSPGLHFPVL